MEGGKVWAQLGAVGRAGVWAKVQEERTTPAAAMPSAHGVMAATVPAHAVKAGRKCYKEAAAAAAADTRQHAKQAHTQRLRLCLTFAVVRSCGVREGRRGRDVPRAPAGGGADCSGGVRQAHASGGGGRGTRAGEEAGARACRDLVVGHDATGEQGKRCRLLLMVEETALDFRGAHVKHAQHCEGGQSGELRSRAHGHDDTSLASVGTRCNSSRSRRLERCDRESHTHCIALHCIAVPAAVRGLHLRCR